MTTTHTNLELVEGEVYILKQSFISKRPENINDSGVLKINFTDNTFGYYFLYEEETFQREIIASTAKLENVPKLDRKHFVKPKVDVEELAWKKYPDEHDSYYKRQAFEDGYNFKEAEFTKEDMEKAIFAGYGMFYDDDTHDKIFEDLIKEIRPLSLPKSVTLNENNEIIAVKW